MGDGDPGYRGGEGCWRGKLVEEEQDGSVLRMGCDEEFYFFT